MARPSCGKIQGVEVGGNHLNGAEMTAESGYTSNG